MHQIKEIDLNLLYTLQVLDQMMEEPADSSMPTMEEDGDDGINSICDVGIQDHEELPISSDAGMMEQNQNQDVQVNMKPVRPVSSIAYI